MLVGLVAWIPGGFGGQGCPPRSIEPRAVDGGGAVGVDCLADVMAATVVAAAGRFNRDTSTCREASLFSASVHSR